MGDRVKVRARVQEVKYQLSYPVISASPFTLRAILTISPLLRLHTVYNLSHFDLMVVKWRGWRACF